MSGKRLVLAGDGEFAEIVYEYFTHDSDYEVVAFTVDRAYLKKEHLFGIPVVAIEDVHRLFPPQTHDACVAVTYTQLNRVRTRLYRAMKASGYRMASYISSKASIWHNATVGENCIIFEFNVVQYKATVGDNVVMWTSNHIGHRGVVESNCFLTSHVTMAGYSHVGESCFLGAGCIIGDSVTVAADTIIGAGAVVLRDVPARQVMRGNPAIHAGVDSFRIFGVRGEG